MIFFSPLTWHSLFKQQNVQNGMSRAFTAWKVSKCGVISSPYFLYLGWIRRFIPYISVFSSNTGKYLPEIIPYLDTFRVVIPLLVTWRTDGIQIEQSMRLGGKKCDFGNDLLLRRSWTKCWNKLKQRDGSEMILNKCYR